MIRALPFLLFAAPALAEGNLAAKVAGQYGSVDDPAFSCAENPVDLQFTDRPPHGIFTWDTARKIHDDSLAQQAVYDLLGETRLGLLMRLEGETRRTDSGAPVVWVLRPDADFGGFCWGRADWPLVRCISPFRRCNLAPTS